MITAWRQYNVYDTRTRCEFKRVSDNSLLVIAPAQHGKPQSRELPRYVRAGIAVHQVQTQTHSLAERQRFILLLRQQSRRLLA